MKRIALLAIAALALTLFAPALLAQEEHGEFGVFFDYTRLHHFNDANLVGVGGQLAFNLNKFVQLEGSMAYDFERNVTSTIPGGATTSFSPSGLRLLNGMFGPKFQTGIGPVKAYVTVKGGFLNFGVSNRGVATGFANQIGTVTDGDTNGVIYPAGGIELFTHHIGIRVEAGDFMYFDNGVNHNLKASIGPQIRW